MKSRRQTASLRYGPVKIECTHERTACKDCGATISREGGQHDHVENDEIGIEE
jgi:hypothetical protein